MSIEDSKDTRKKILVVKKSDDDEAKSPIKKELKGGSNKEDEPTISIPGKKDGPTGTSDRKDCAKASSDKKDCAKASPEKKDESKTKSGDKPSATENHKEKGAADETVVVIPQEPKDLAPLGGAAIFNANTSEAKEGDVEETVIKTPGTVKNDNKKQTVVVTNENPTDIAPLGNVNGILSTADKSKSDTADEPRKTDECKKDKVVIGGDKNTKDASSSKPSTAAVAGAGAVAGAAVAGAAVAGRSNNHVSIDEKKNLSHTVARDRNAPKRLENVPESSILNELRRNNSVVAEGFMYKKRPWFFCFWVQKYFILLKTGELLFIELDGTGSGSGDWNIRHSNALNKLDYEGYSHPSRLAFSSDTSTGYFAFDCQEERNYWFETLQDVSRS